MYSTHVQTICNCFVADVDRIEQHWSSLKKTGVTESGRKLAMKAFAFQLQEEKSIFHCLSFRRFLESCNNFTSRRFCPGFCYNFENRANLVGLLAAD